eukprot:TRINITY_DN918_c0_g2_i1.p1 TRINITY_DN918_c0_g2~~TRINITY_DN918_c0_g2_i1.p1  ORF type:complete len:455 (-),score=106.78 TRINITY_DN918_c0_g2_i1:124-1488(-)
MSKSGYMTKEGGSIKTWKKRYFVLKDGRLSYFKNPGEDAIDTLVIANAMSIKAADPKKKSKQNCFEIALPGRTYAFSCDSEEEKKAWIDVLTQSLKSGGSGSSSASNSFLNDKSSGASSIAKDKVSVEDFDLLNLLGKGSFGKVMQVRKKDTGRIYAMKVLDKKHILDHGEVVHTRSEKNILQKVHHPFLVNLVYSFQTTDKLYLVMDFVNGGEMFFHLQKDKRFSEERSRFYAAEILLALEHLHANGIIYRDLKPENILFTHDGHICLTDFGLCKEGIETEADRTGTFCGTPEYLAPEVLTGKGYSKPVDWWSFGSLLYEMLTGLPPFYSQDVQEMYRKIIHDKLKFPQNMNPDAMSLIDGLLQRDFNQRLKDPSIIKKHPFFSTIDWDGLVSKRVKAPFVPDVSGEHDVSQIDPAFIEEAANITPTDSNEIDKAEQSNFEGFTFVSGGAALH